jgi:hypothetical protein
VIAVTESEWWSAPDPLNVIDWLFFDTPAAERKFRLFAAACCRRVEQVIRVPEALDALECAERFADGFVSVTEASASCQRAIGAYQDRWRGQLDPTNEADACRAVIWALSDFKDLRSPYHRSRAWYESEDAFPYPYWSASDAVEAVTNTDASSIARVESEKLAQVRLLHDIFGPLPFRDVVVNPSWLTSDVLALARGIYDDRAFDRMPILADALQDAGCDSDDILFHCRDATAAHVRGCWVVDLLLGRPWREE